MQIKLIVVNGQAKQRERVLELPAVVGRSRAAAVTIGDPLVSRQHCFLEEHGGMVLVRDNGSLNGTILDGERIQGEAIVRPGAKLTVGPLTFVIIYEPTGEGVQADTGLMPPAAAGAPDFEALVAGAGGDADEEEEPADDAGLDEPVDDEPADDEVEEEAAAPDDDGRATFQWLPPPAAASPSFLPPPAAGPIALPGPSAAAGDKEAAEEPAPPTRTQRNHGKPAATPDKAKTTANPKTAAPKQAPREPSPAAEEAAPVASLGFDWLGASGDGASDESDPADFEDEGADEPGADDQSADDPMPDDEQVLIGDAASESEQTPQAPAPAEKPPKKKRSWWPFGKKSKATETKTKTKTKPDSKSSSEASEDTRHGADEETEAVERHAEPRDKPAPTVGTPPGAKVALPPAADNEPQEAEPAVDDDGKDDDDAFQQFFKGIG